MTTVEQDAYMKGYTGSGSPDMPYDFREDLVDGEWVWVDQNPKTKLKRPRITKQIAKIWAMHWERGYRDGARYR